MRRAALAIGATVVGLVGVLSFHTSPSKFSLGALPVGTSTRSTSTSNATTPAGASPPTTGAPPTPTSTPATGGAPAPTSPPTTAPAATSTAPPTSRTATGPSVDYNFGTLSVTVTVSGSKLTNVTIGAINDGWNPRSQSIDQQSIPILEQQALQAQGASIQGVSGASYTSAGFQQSLQAALSQLGVR